MNFTVLDWSAIVGYLLITLGLGLYFRRRSGKSVDDYFVSGRRVSWWLAGTSMVATTFAADTPLVVTGLVYSQGIAGNWLWWSFLLSGMMTVFLFARLWRRSGLLTDVQFAEMRYSGKPAAFLRGFRALYLGLLMNCLILGWVTKAMTTIVATTLGLTDRGALMVCVFFLIPFTGLYVALGGLWGVLWTDLFQFVLKMGIVIAVAYYGVQACGGMSSLLARLAAARAAAGPNAGDATSFFPDFSRPLSSEALWTLPALTFLVNLGLQWWAFWYPGAEPGGGGYIAQRIFSAKDERNGVLSVLWFNIAHYAVRPWPWILTALSVIVLYPKLEHPEAGYMMVVTQHVPPALRGIVVAGFMAAFMSTFATQLNWGASYLVADFYRRFLKKDGSETHYVKASRVSTVVLVIVSAYVSAQLASIRSGLGVRAGSRSGNRRRLPAALVLVADQCLERDFRDGDSARLNSRAALVVAILRQSACRVCQDRNRNHRADDARLGCRNLPDLAGTRARAGGFLPPRSPARQRMASDCSPCSRRGADPRSRAQSGLLDSWLRNGLRRALWRRMVDHRTASKRCAATSDCCRLRRCALP